MRKIRISHDLNVPGWGMIPQGTEYKVERFNSRYVYVELNRGVELRLARKADTETVY